MSAAERPDHEFDDLPPIEHDSDLDDGYPEAPASLATRERQRGMEPYGPESDGPESHGRGPESNGRDTDGWDHGAGWDQDAHRDAEWDGPRSALNGHAPGAASLEPSWNAAGVIVLRSTDTGPRIAVLESGGVVSLPKAEVGPGESSETAAMRAAEAFTGRRVRLTESLGESVEIVDNTEVTAWFWLARAGRGVGLDGSHSPTAGFALHWLDVEEAATALTSEGERQLVERLRLRPLRPRRRPFASSAHRGLVQELEAFRDDSVSMARDVSTPEQLEALFRAREEIERAEERLARGDDAGARRARARAERETLGSLDAEGRALALRRALERAPDHLRPALTAAVPSVGAPVSLDVLLAVQSTVDAAVEEEARACDARRSAQMHATAALMVTAIAILVAAGFGLFREAPRPVLGTVGAAIVFLISGQLGGWVGESLHALRDRNPARHLSLPLAAAAGGIAGLAVGAVLSGGLAGFLVEDAALTVAATFVAGWVVRAILPR